MNLLLWNTFIHIEKLFFFFVILMGVFSVKMLFKSLYLKWDFYCNCSKRTLIALTSEVFQKKLSGLCVWSGSTMQRCSRKEMYCINSNKPQETYNIYESSSHLLFRGVRYKECWNQGQRCHKGLREMRTQTSLWEWDNFSWASFREITIITTIKNHSATSLSTKAEQVSVLWDWNDYLIGN